MIKAPDNFTAAEKKAYQKAWFNVLKTTLFGIKFILIIIIGALFYIPLQPHFDFDFSSKIKDKTQSYTSKESADDNDDPNKVENGIHLQTGLAYGPGFELVRANCTVCHSAKLVTQNRATEAGWNQMIDWMQATQGLWDLGKNRPKIVAYLSQHYAPEEKGRRTNIDLEKIEWYILELD